MLKKNDKLVAPSEIINALHVLYNEGKDKELLFRLNKLKEIYPHTPEIYNIMGAIAVKKSHESEAISNFNKAIDLDKTTLTTIVI